MGLRTSQSHPLLIDTVATPTGGTIGMTFCPGKHDAHAVTGGWARDIDADLQAIKDWGASSLVTLMETHELDRLAVADLGFQAVERGLAWYHLPIRDVSTPDGAFETQWAAAGAEVHGRLASGQRIVVHCRGGLGRTGMIAARLLIEFGAAPRDAIVEVRRARPGAIETVQQERYVLGLATLSRMGPTA